MNEKNQNGTITANDRILTSIRVAKARLGKSMKTPSDETLDSFDKDIWIVAEELEYTLFLLSLVVQDDDGVAPKKPDSESAKGMDSLLVETKRLLNRAEKSVMKDMLLDAFAESDVARNHILKVQNWIAKRKREVFGKK